MARVPIVDFKTMQRVLLKLGFEAVRQRGSHVFFRHLDGRATSVPNHPARDLSRPLLAAILDDINISAEDFVKML